MIRFSTIYLLILTICSGVFIITESKHSNRDKLKPVIQADHPSKGKFEYEVKRTE